MFIACKMNYNIRFHPSTHLLLRCYKREVAKILKPLRIGCEMHTIRIQHKKNTKILITERKGERADI